jgi:hypothetical protein
MDSALPARPSPRSYYDLHDGMRASAELTTDFVLAQFDAVRQLHVVLFVLSLLLSAAFLLLMFRPFIKRWAARCQAGSSGSPALAAPPACRNTRLPSVGMVAACMVKQAAMLPPQSVEAAAQT